MAHAIRRPYDTNQLGPPTQASDSAVAPACVSCGTNETVWFSILDGAGEQGNDGGEETQANDRDRHAAEDGKVSTQLEQEQDVDDEEQNGTNRPSQDSFP